MEFRPIIASLTGEAYRGPEGVRRWLAEITRRFPGSEAKADAIEERRSAGGVSGRPRRG